MRTSVRPARMFIASLLGLLALPAVADLASAAPPNVTNKRDNNVVKVGAADGRDYVGMVSIPGGNVRMGRTEVYDVYVEGFYIDVLEVSNAQYKEFIDAGGYTTEVWWNPVGWAWRVANDITLPDDWNSNTYHGGGIPGNEDFPVNGVSWWEADAYCRWAGKRLPTEAEWEKAAKGGCEMWGDPGSCDGSDTPSYPWGEGISGPRANYDESGDPYENSGQTTPVGYYDGSNHGGYQTQDSPSPYGLYDVAGNIWEWCSTKYASYPYDPNDGRENPPATYSECCRVLRGGGCDHTTGGLECASRHSSGPDTRYYDTSGFRCAKSQCGQMCFEPAVVDTTFPCGTGILLPVHITMEENPNPIGEFSFEVTFEFSPHLDFASCSKGELTSAWYYVGCSCSRGEDTVVVHGERGTADAIPPFSTGTLVTLLFEMNCAGVVYGDSVPTVRCITNMAYDCSTFVACPCREWTIMGIADVAVDIPTELSLGENYPNPFNPGTTIEYDLPAPGGRVNLAVHNVRGRLVRMLVDGDVEPGRHKVYWDGKDDAGKIVSSGVYFYRLETPRGAEQKKAVLLK